MKRKDDPPVSICVRTLRELDALVGKYLTGETPCVHWVNLHTDFRFDSIEEALEAESDPFFCDHDESATTVVMEVREFRRYSAEITLAWELVAHLSHSLEPLLVRRGEEQWEGAFGSREFITAATAPVAICLAALRARGIEVDCQLEPPDAFGIQNAKINSLYSRP